MTRAGLIELLRNPDGNDTEELRLAYTMLVMAQSINDFTAIAEETYGTPDDAALFAVGRYIETTIEARTYRVAGDIRRAKRSEWMAERIYNELPPHAKW